MADNRRIIEQYLDVENNARKDLPEIGAAFQDPSAEQEVYRGTQVLFRSHCLMADASTAFEIPVDAALLFGIDNTFTADHNDLVLTLNADFNVSGDWTEADRAAGKICWRADFTGAALKTALGDDASLTGYAYLWMCPAGGSYTLLAKWNITIHNVAVDPTTATPSESISYVTTDSLTSTLGLYVKKHEDGATAVFSNGTWYLYCADDALYYPLGVAKIDGTVVLNIGQTGVSL